MDSKAPEKKERLLAALEQGMVMVHLDARRPGVLVPPSFRGEAHLRLNLSYKFEPPDLSVGDWGVRSTLSFGGSRFTVAIPWSALFAISSHGTKEFWMYPDDMPPELVQHAPDPAVLPMPAPQDGARSPGALREVPVMTSLATPAPSEDGPSDEPPAPPRRGHLRIVK